jgi:hypothetical protein
MSVTENADFAGAAFVLKHPVGVGLALHLAMPLPKSLRRHDLTQPGYNVYAVVRNTTFNTIGQRVGVMFLGRQAPRGYTENPGGRFLLPTDQVAAPVGARRDHRAAPPRHELSVPLKVSRPEAASGLAHEQTISTEIGLSGTMVYTSMPVARGDKVLVEDLQGDLRTEAQVESVSIGADNIPRMDLRFLEDGAADGVRRILKRAGIAAG